MNDVIENQVTRFDEHSGFSRTDLAGVPPTDLARTCREDQAQPRRSARLLTGWRSRGSAWTACAVLAPATRRAWRYGSSLNWQPRTTTWLPIWRSTAAGYRRGAPPGETAGATSTC